MTSREYFPPAPFNEFVYSMYFLKGDMGSASQEILPDFKTDLIFLQGPALKGKIDGFQEYEISGVFVNGFRRSVLHFSYQGETELLGIRFLPYGFTRLFGIHPREISSPRPLDEVLGISRTSGLTERLSAAEEPEMKFRVLLGWLMNAIMHANPDDSLPLRALNRISSTHGILPLTAVCNNSPSEYKQLQRFCHKTLEICPKFLARMVRFEHLHNSLRTQKQPDWISLVCSLGLTDQSHLIREVRQFTGLSPREFHADLESYI